MLARAVHLRALARPAATAVRALSDAAASQLTLNFSTPHDTIYSAKKVDRITVPGAAGQYGITAGHAPIISELQAGVVQITHEPGQTPERYFVSGGFSLTHANSVTDVSVGEAVKVEDLDEAAVRSGHAQFVAALNSAAEGSKERAEAQIGVAVHTAMAQALGITL